MTKKETVLGLVKEGKTTKEISKITGLAISTVRYHREPGRAKNHSSRIAEHRRKVKRKAIDYSGGKCLGCEYDRCIDSLTFHHPDPKEKEINISKGDTRSWVRIKKEVDKTVLVCRNCHGEIHAGLWDRGQPDIGEQKAIRAQYVDKPLAEYRDEQKSGE